MPQPNTNVPENVRQMWREVYILFDTHYLMDVSKQESWDSFWSGGRQILEKYKDIPSVIELLGVTSELISKLAAVRAKA